MIDVATLPGAVRGYFMQCCLCACRPGYHIGHISLSEGLYASSSLHVECESCRRLHCLSRNLTPCVSPFTNAIFLQAKGVPFFQRDRTRCGPACASK